MHRGNRICLVAIHGHVLVSRKGNLDIIGCNLHLKFKLGGFHETIDLECVPKFS